MTYYYVWLALRLILGGPSVGDESNPLPEPIEVPLYPDAHESQTEEDYVVRLTTFYTAAAPHTVLAWYKEVLLKGGWQFEKGDDRALWFWYLGGEDDSSYRLTVFARGLNTGLTSVKLRLVIVYAM